MQWKHMVYPRNTDNLSYTVYQSESLIISLPEALLRLEEGIAPISWSPMASLMVLFNPFEVLDFPFALFMGTCGACHMRSAVRRYPAVMVSTDEGNLPYTYIIQAPQQSVE